MLLAVEGGGLFSASASGYSKGLSLLLCGDKDGERAMRVVPYEALDSIKKRVSRGCACFGGASETVPSPSPSASDKGKDEISEVDSSSSKEAFKLSLRSSLKRPSLAESRSLEDIQEYETLTLDLAADMARRKVQWPDACGSQLTQVREFEPSEMGLSDEEWEIGRQRTCSCVIM